MVECPHCQIGFSASYAVCPRCKQFETPHNERMGYLKSDAKKRLHDGDIPESVRTALIENGFSDMEADDLLRCELASLARENRWFGFIRMATGFVMLCFGAVCLGLAVLRRDLPGRGFALLLIGGGVLFCTGLLAIVSGGVTTLTGKEVGIAPPWTDEVI